jgi:CO/xanthine dehydrogenase FAD-binding subunit
LVAEGIDPISDLRGSAEYRREMVRISAKRTMESLIQEAPAKERS